MNVESSTRETHGTERGRWECCRRETTVRESLVYFTLGTRDMGVPFLLVVFTNCSIFIYGMGYAQCGFAYMSVQVV